MSDDLTKLADTGLCLLFSKRAALDRAGVPTTGDGGAPVSDGWRAEWAADELVRVREDRDTLRWRAGDLLVAMDRRFVAARHGGPLAELNAIEAVNEASRSLRSALEGGK